MQQFASKRFPLIGFNPPSTQFGKQRRENTLPACPGCHWPPHGHGKEGAGFSETALGFRSQAVLRDLFHVRSRKYTVRTDIVSGSRESGQNP